MTSTRHDVSAVIETDPYWSVSNPTPVWVESFQVDPATPGFTKTQWNPQDADVTLFRTLNDQRGRYEMRYDFTSVTPEVNEARSQPIPLVLGKTYRVVAHVYTTTIVPSTGITASVGVVYDDPLGADQVAVLLDTSPQEVTHTFTATPSVIVTLMGSSVGGTGRLYWQDVAIYEVERTTYLDLRPESTQVTLDESWMPYAQATLTCAIPTPDVLTKIDPRTNKRVTITLSSTEREALLVAELTAMLNDTVTPDRVNLVTSPRSALWTSGMAATTDLSGPSITTPNGVQGGTRFQTSTSYSNPTFDSDTTVDLTAGAFYQASVYVRSTQAVTYRLSLRPTSTTANIDGDPVALVPGVWTRLIMSTPAAITVSEPYALRVRPVGNVIFNPDAAFDVTQALVEPISPTAVQTGTRTNICVNPSFTSGISGTLGNGGVASWQHAGGYSGADFLRSTASTTAIVNTGPPISVIPGGGQFAYSAYVKTTVGTRSVRLEALFYSAANGTGLITTALGNVVTLTSSWQRIALTGIVPSNARSVNVRAATSTTGAAGDTLDVDAFLMEHGTLTIGTYFDGGTPGASWVGSPGASASSLPVMTVTAYPAPGDYFDGSIGRVVTPPGFPLWNGTAFASTSRKVFGAVKSSDFTAMFSPGALTVAYMSDLFGDQYNALLIPSLNRSRTFNLGLRTRSLDYVSGTMTLGLTGNEMLLDDYGRIDLTNTKWQPPATTSLKTLVTWGLALIGDTLDPSSSDFTIDAGDVVWNQGEPLWSFLDAFIQLAGLRLYCDETGKWFIKAPFKNGSGSVSISALTTLTDTLTRETWADSVVVANQWVDLTTGDQTTSFAGASASGRVTRTMKITRISKAKATQAKAAAIAARTVTRGRIIALAAVNNLAVTPGNKAYISTPATTIDPVLVSGVTWNFPDDEMTVSTRDIG